MERVEVITSVERRRRYSDEQKLAMLAEARRTSVARVAAKYEIALAINWPWVQMPVSQSKKLAKVLAL